MSLVRRAYRTWSASDIINACRLYLVTDMNWLGDRTLHSVVAEAVCGGVTFVQLRKKDADTMRLAKLARDLMPVCRIANVPLVINDDLEAAKVAGVDGVHVGQSDISCEDVRREIGTDAIVGVTVHTVEEAMEAQRAGATYLMVGNMFPSRWNHNNVIISGADVKAIADSVKIPVVASGGITPENVKDLSGIDIGGIAVMSSILASPDIESAARELSGEVAKYLVD